MKRYELDSRKTMDYFENNLKEINRLSDSILSVLISQPGKFYAFLPENILLETIHEFDVGGKTRSLRKEVGKYLSDLLKSDKNLFCIFDDYNAALSGVEIDDLYKTNGMHYKNEVYYLIKSGADEDLVVKCLRYSSAIWHSLCVISEIDLIESEKKVINEEEINAMCMGAVFVMIEAYDAESYIFWEKTLGHQDAGHTQSDDTEL